MFAYVSLRAPYETVVVAVPLLSPFRRYKFSPGCAVFRRNSCSLAFLVHQRTYGSVHACQCVFPRTSSSPSLAIASHSRLSTYYPTSFTARGPPQVASFLLIMLRFVRNGHVLRRGRTPDAICSYLRTKSYLTVDVQDCRLLGGSRRTRTRRRGRPENQLVR